MQSLESKDGSIQRYVDISYLPTEHHGPVMDHSKDFQFDFMCTDASGTVFIVEMQRYHEDYWFKRCVSYASRAYDRQNRKGDRRSHVARIYHITHKTFRSARGPSAVRAEFFVSVVHRRRREKNDTKT